MGHTNIGDCDDEENASEGVHGGRTFTSSRARVHTTLAPAVQTVETLARTSNAQRLNRQHTHVHSLLTLTSLMAFESPAMSCVFSSFTFSSTGSTDRRLMAHTPAPRADRCTQRIWHSKTTLRPIVRELPKCATPTPTPHAHVTPVGPLCKQWSPLRSKRCQHVRR